MDGPDLIFLSRGLVAVFGLLFIARLLYSARAYISWRAFAYYAAALVSLPVIFVLRFELLGVADHVVVRQGFETVLLVGVAGGLLEHVRADQLRVRDSVRLMEQWRLSTGLAQRRTRELEVLAGITSQLVSSLDLRRVLQTVVDQALLLAGADLVTLYMRDRETGLLSAQGAIAAASAQSLAAPPPPRPGGLTATVAGTGEPAFIADAAAHPLYRESGYARLRAIAALPLRLEGDVLGVMNVVYEQPHPFDDGEMRMLTALADTSALAVHNATLHERIAKMAVTDELTGLANRRRFLEVLRAEVQRARRYWRPLSLLMVDLDKLKAINDQHGHDAGDAVLRGLAQWLRGTVRDTDLAARLGGDEFALLLPETGGDAALAIAERLRAGMAAWSVDANGVPVGSTVSIGLASCAAGDLPELPGFLKLADNALYRAKAAGRNSVRAAESIYDSSIDAPA
jgi:diguanylate cyclase (GGDEF)-like protein